MSNHIHTHEATPSMVAVSDSNNITFAQEWPVGTMDITRTTALAASVLAILFVIYHRYCTKLQLADKLPSQSSHREKVLITEPKAEQTTTTVPFTKPKPGSVQVTKIYVHPIKSCRGTSVPSAKFTPKGLEIDREWCIVDATANTIITARTFPTMILIAPRIELDSSSPYSGLLTVTFPEDSGCQPFSVPLRPTEELLKTWTMIPKISFWSKSVDGYVSESLPSPILSSESTPSAILSKYFKKPVHLVYQSSCVRELDPTAAFPNLQGSTAYQDTYPLMILSEESIGQIEKEVRERVGTQGIEERWRDEKVTMERFRPNIVINGGGPYGEDFWEEISFGSAGGPTISLVSKCIRCLLPNVSPDTGERDNAVPYKVLMKVRTGLDPEKMLKPCLGSNAVPTMDGVVNVGDIVYVKKMASVV